ncbi:MAG: DUF3570 domain-containing protein [Calditrichae bacterium]|nr:DUF3570 domain-containing protein [Calditrichota bacterium]MCB9057977.1 DUF3570 domain-containing protein [Calditrichia bacterium]
MDKKLALGLLILLFLSGSVLAQDLPDDELQVNISGYFDSFDVNVMYPSIAITRKVSDKTSITGRYLVDMITAASMKTGGSSSSGSGEREHEDDDEGREHDFGKTSSATSVNSVDAVTAASSRGGGGVFGGEGLSSFDDVRNEFNLGVSQIVGENLISLNGIYSTERDYTSSTLAGTISRQFAMKNTTLQLGFVRSWDKVFPVIKDWTRSKDVVTYSANFSQLLGKSALIQFLTSYSENNGYLADAYNQVSVDSMGTMVLRDPIHPNNRIRKAAATQLKFRLSEQSSMQMGYRYYWDNWDVVSHTFSMNYMRHMSDHVVLGLGWRTYLQNRAFFFKPQYAQPEALMTSDIKLDKGYSNQLQFELTLNGGRGQDYLPFLTSEKIQYNISLNVYSRHTQSGYWYNGQKNMIATNFNLGIRYRF